MNCFINNVDLKSFVSKFIISLPLILIFTTISGIYQKLCQLINDPILNLISIQYLESSLNTIEPKDDIHFEIIEPESLRYTFRARPAQNFGTSFVCTFIQ